MGAATRRTLLAGLVVISACLARSPQPTTVILVRHAERDALSTPDPELTPAGRLRAQVLVGVVGDAGIQAIITTQYARAQATVTPLAIALGITPEIMPDTGAGHAHDVAEAILKKHVGQTVLVVGHGHTLLAIMRALGVTQAMSPLCESQYDLIFVVSVASPGPTRVVRARYGAVTPPDSTCLLGVVERPSTSGVRSRSREMPPH